MANTVKKITPTAKVRSSKNYKGVDTRQDFLLTSRFLGYRNREDKTLLPLGWMISGSQNVLIDISGRLKNRKGMTIDGQISSAFDITAKGSFDWLEHKNNPVYLRYNGGQVQFRYVDSSGVVKWTNIITGLITTNKVRFTNYWDNTELMNVCLFVNGTQNVYEWNGSIATYASSTSNTITLQGTYTWDQLGFYATANKKIVLAGITYTYTGGDGTTTLTGVTPDPTGGSQVVGDLIYQLPVITATSSITSFPSNYNINGIANKDNMIFYGSEQSNNIIGSNINNYKSVAYSSPRLPAEGFTSTLRSSWRAFRVQESDMYVSSGKSQWSVSKQLLSSDNVHESFGFTSLKATANLGALSQEAINSDRNSVVYISNEPRLLTLGRTVDILGSPMNTEYSYPIANDMNSVDTTDACVFYDRSYVYMSFPKSGVWFILNQTDPNNIFWEAPQTGNIASFSNINGNLYVHDYYTAQTFKLFDSYQDNGNPILSIAQFSYYDYGNKGLSKYFNEFWVEGYISANTDLELDYLYELDGCQTKITKFVKGTSSNVCALTSGGGISGGSGILGDQSLGSLPLGSTTLTALQPIVLPPYFAMIKVSLRKDFYKMSTVFKTYGKDYHWELLAFGPLVQDTMYGNNSLKEN
jgi:hypothetical protein